MKRKKNKTKKKIIIISSALVVVAAIGGGLFWRTQSMSAMASESVIMNSTVSVGDIRTTIEASGALEAGESTMVSIPNTIEVEEYTVSQGDVVAEGDQIAVLNELSVKETYYYIEETLEELEDDQDDTDDDEAEYYELEKQILDLEEAFVQVEAMMEGYTLVSTESGEIITLYEETEAETTESQSSGSVSLVEQDIMEIQAETDMLAYLTIDEMDILSVSLGQKVYVSIDALAQTEVEGSITEIDLTGAEEGGTTKYTVEVSIPKQEQMLSGMSLSASIVIEENNDLLLLPVDAISNEGQEIFVYTSHDESTGELGGKTAVTVGTSDGMNVQISEGLAEGDVVYYEFNISGESGSTTEQMMSGMMGGGMMDGGAMPEGMEMPSGGGMMGGGSSSGSRPSR